MQFLEEEKPGRDRQAGQNPAHTQDIFTPLEMKHGHFDANPISREQDHHTELVVSRRNQYFPITVALHRRDKSCPFHFFDQPRGTVVPDAQMPLHQ